MLQPRTSRWVFLSAIAVLLFSTFSQTAKAIMLDRFVFSSEKEARKTWSPNPGSPPVEYREDGLVLPCPFKKDIVRCSWDRSVSLDLSPVTSFKLDLACEHPEAIRALSIYFKSGNGWYVWNKPLKTGARQQIVLMKTDFEEEKDPAGWNRIEAIRIAPWKDQPVNTTLTLYGFAAQADTILLVQGTLSARESNAQNVARKVTRRLSGWLSEMSIAHGIIDDEAVERGGLDEARLAILAYNPYPPEAELEALRSFVRKGGKLVVCFGGTAELAELMDLRLGMYVRAEAPGRWSSFSFSDPAAWNVPARLHQESFNIVPAYPAGPTARVIAYWENADGKKTEDPAWLASEHGLWMTHILMDDDMVNKQRMLAGLLGHYEPSVWPAAARYAIDTSGRIDSYRNFSEAVDAIADQAAGLPQEKEIRDLLTQCRDLHRKMETHFQKGLFVSVVDLSGELHQRLIEAYARIQQPRTPEFRGIWDHDGVGWYPGDWERTCKILREQGFTAIFPNMLWGGLAHYSSKVLPESSTYRTYGDQLKQCIEAAHRNGLEVHVWKVCWHVVNAPSEFRHKLTQQGRLQVSLKGRTAPWLNPAHPQNVTLALNSLKEIARNYDVDGIHLDYIRYPGADYCFSPATRSFFEKSIGSPIKDWPAAVRPEGRLQDEFQRWRAEQITSFVRLAHDEIKAINPRIKLSAAVYSSYPNVIKSLGQNWGLWLKEGYVDFVCPMNYTTDPSAFSQMCRRQIALPDARGRIYPGLGVTADESQLTPDQVIEEINILRKLDAPGFMLFDLTTTLRDETLPMLRLGLTRPE